MACHTSNCLRHANASYSKLTLNDNAFSIVEVVVVVVIIATIASIAIPRYANALTRYRANATAKRITLAFELTKATAKQTSASRTISFNTTNHTCTLVGVQDLDSKNLTDTTIDLQSEPFGATLVSADFNGDTNVIFNGYGVPDSGGSLIIQVGDEQRTIQLDQITGKARVQ